MEFLYLCHTYISGIPSAETDSRLTTIGRIPNPIEKTRLDYLQPWTDFATLQDETLRHLLNCYPLADQPQVSESRHTMKENSTMILARVTPEKDIEIV